MTFSQFKTSSHEYWREIFHDGSGEFYFHKKGDAGNFVPAALLVERSKRITRYGNEINVFNTSTFVPITKDQFEVVLHLSENNE